MKIVHLADLHLGYRQYNRVTSQGLNWREADVFHAFRSAVSKITEINPDLILIAGDMFHQVRPTNLCIQHTFRTLLDLRKKTQAPVVIIGGNHDSPRSIDTGCILELFQNVPGVYVVHSDYKGIKLPEIDIDIYLQLLASVHLGGTVGFDPDKFNLSPVLS
jgi:DNA repair exonuclease SbcCD nuclease subunit